MAVGCSVDIISLKVHIDNKDMAEFKEVSTITPETRVRMISVTITLLSHLSMISSLFVSASPVSPLIPDPDSIQSRTISHHEDTGSVFEIIPDDN